MTPLGEQSIYYELRVTTKFFRSDLYILGRTLLVASKMVLSLRSILLTGLALLPITKAQSDLIGTWSTKSRSVFTGPVCTSALHQEALEDARCGIRCRVLHGTRGSDISSRVFTIPSTRRCLSPRSLVLRTRSPQMAITKKPITEQYQIVRSIAYVCRTLLTRPPSSKPSLPSRHYTMATRNLPKTIQRLTHPLAFWG